MELTQEFFDSVKLCIEQKEADKLKEMLVDLHPADIAELCNDLNLDDARFIYRLLDNETAADVLVEADEDARKELLEALPSETIAKRFVDYMDTDDAVDVMRELDEDKQEEILAHIEDIEQAGDIVDLLKYDEDTAGGLMGTEMVTVNENWSMPECLKEMRMQAGELDEIYYVYVVDDDERLRGVFPLTKMITSPSVSKVKHVMEKDPISVHVDTSIEEVAQIIEKYDLVAVPVVDSIGRLMGQITVDDVMDDAGLPLIGSIIQRLIIGKRHIHIRRIAHILVIHPGARLHRMQTTGPASLRLRGLVKAHQQQRQKRHIIAQGKPSGLGGTLPDLPADAAVNTAVAVLLLLIQFLQIRRYKSEHRPHLLFPYLKNQL